MDIKSVTEKIFKKYGQPMTVTRNNKSTEICAFMQPLRYKNKMYVDPDMSPLGIKDISAFLFFGPASCNFSQNPDTTVIHCKDRSFSVLRSDLIGVGKSDAYIWAVLIPFIKDGAYAV